MGANHARVLDGLPGIELVSVVDSDPQRAAAFPEIGSAKLDDLWNSSPDYVVIAAPTALHAELALQCVDRGIHALIEKPITSSSTDAKKLEAAFSNAGLIGGVGHIERFNAAVREARARIEFGDLGEVFQIATRRTGPFPSRITDVGVTMDLATHDVDLTAWVAQSPYATVSAASAFRTGRPHEDLIAATGTLKTGAVFNHLVNWLSPLKERTVTILGDKGAFVVDTLTADLTYYANGQFDTEWLQLAQFRGVSEGDVVRYAFPKPEPLRVMHANFRDAVQGMDAHVVSLSEAAQTVVVAEAIVRSASLASQSFTL